MDHREVDAPWIGADRVEVSGMVGNGKGPDRERRCFCWEVLRALEFPRKGWAKYGWNQQTTPKTQRQMRLANTAQVGQSASVNAGTKPKHLVTTSVALVTNSFLLLLVRHLLLLAWHLLLIASCYY